jgi:hypothetical protein
VIALLIYRADGIVTLILLTDNVMQAMLLPQANAPLELVDTDKPQPGAGITSLLDMSIFAVKVSRDYITGTL